MSVCVFIILLLLRYYQDLRANMKIKDFKRCTILLAPIYKQGLVGRNMVSANHRLRRMETYVW